MNFDSETPVDVLMGQLLAFVIMFEKRVTSNSLRSSTSSADSQETSSFILGWPSKHLTPTKRTKYMRKPLLQSSRVPHRGIRKRFANFSSGNTPKMEYSPMTSMPHLT